MKNDVMRIESARMYLYPLTIEQLNQAKWRLKAVCSSLGIEMTPFGFCESRKKRQIYTAKLSIIDMHPNSWLLSTSWLIVDKQSMTYMGEAGFKGPPGQVYRNYVAIDEVEIGYMLQKEFRQNGYMTEVVETLCRVPFSQSDYKVCAVIARTKPNNFASHGVLKKNGFERFGSLGGLWQWRLTKKT